MKPSTLIAMAGLFSLCWGSAAAVETARWVRADDLRLRDGPGLENRVVGVLQRGDAVGLRGEPFDGFCWVQSERAQGYAACRYLSSEPVARPRAGVDGVPAERRWVLASGALLRAAPHPQAEVLTRPARRSAVRLVGDAGGQAGFCAAQTVDRQGIDSGPSGFMACHLLSFELPAPEKPLPDNSSPAQLAQRFWEQPGWWPLEAYASALTQALPASARFDGPWPRDAELERMKAHLALGLKAAPPEPLPDWTALKQLAAAHDPAVLAPDVQKQARSGKDRDLWAREIRASQAVQRLQNALGLQGPLHDTISAEGGGARVLQLVQALQVPAVRPSLWRSEAEIAPPSDGPEALAGRFGGVVRTVVRARALPVPESQRNAGLYDMRSRTQSTTRPVQRVQLFRDGQLRSQGLTPSAHELLYREVDEPMCAGFRPGYGWGDSDAAIWRYFDQPGMGDPGGRKARATQAATAGSLFAFYAAQVPPLAQARREQQALSFDRQATGFTGAQEGRYDLDGDDVPDLLIWEFTGPGPGHLDGATGTDDQWFRLVLANIGGAWRVLGHDVFAYGCGC